jgi:hypothetical protein
VIDRGKTAVAEVDRIPEDVDLDSVCAHDTDFREALLAREGPAQMRGGARTVALAGRDQNITLPSPML